MELNKKEAYDFFKSLYHPRQCKIQSNQTFWKGFIETFKIEEGINETESYISHEYT
ncbi:hypothetical protein GW750_06845 [bacterium]|nr:hypothetical protein [bacterium]